MTDASVCWVVAVGCWCWLLLLAVGVGCWCACVFLSLRTGTSFFPAQLGRGFGPQRPSGQAVVTGVFRSTPNPPCLLFLRAWASASFPLFLQFFVLVDLICIEFRHLALWPLRGSTLRPRRQKLSYLDTYSSIGPPTRNSCLEFGVSPRFLL